MSLSPLPKDARISDVIETLARPIDYVRGVVDHQFECKRHYGVAYVRIGITGQGIKPHYRIEYLPEQAGRPWNGVFNAYRGDNHKVMVPEENEDILREFHWSSRAMTFEETQALLGALRIAKRGK